MGTSWLGPTAMVLAAVAALGCVLASSPRRLGAVIAATVMVVSMADMALGHVLLTPVLWAGLLVALGVFVVALPRSADSHDVWPHGLALVAAAAIVLVSPHALPTASAVGHAGHQSQLAPTGGWGPGLAIAMAYAVLALLPTGRTQLLQVIMTTGCLALMAVVPSLA